MSWLDAFIKRIKSVSIAGQELPVPETAQPVGPNFVSGVSGSFNSSTGNLDLTVTVAPPAATRSPVSIMIASDALSGLGYAGDTLTSSNSALTVGVGFIANEAGHTCTGVRFWWNPVIAGTVTATLWAMTISGGGTSVGTVTGAASGDTTLSFAPVTLVKGATYMVSVYDGAHYCHIGTVAGGTSFVNTQLGTPTLWANSWLQYVQHANNGGGGTSTPFSAYVNAPNAFPVNQGGQFMPIEPVLT